MEKSSLYDYTEEQLNKVEYMPINQKKYSWYDAAIVMSCREIDEYLLANSHLGGLSESFFGENKKEEYRTNNIIVMLKAIVNLVHKCASNKTGMLSKSDIEKYNKLGNHILELFDELEKDPAFAVLKNQFEEYMEHVSEYFCLSNLEYLTKNIAQGTETMGVNSATYKLLEVVEENIKNRKVTKEDIDKMNRLVSSADFSDIPDHVIDVYLTYINSFSQIINHQKLNKR